MPNLTLVASLSHTRTCMPQWKRHNYLYIIFLKNIYNAIVCLCVIPQDLPHAAYFQMAFSFCWQGAPRCLRPLFLKWLWRKLFCGFCSPWKLCESLSLSHVIFGGFRGWMRTWSFCMEKQRLPQTRTDLWKPLPKIVVGCWWWLVCHSKMLCCVLWPILLCPATPFLSSCRAQIYFSLEGPDLLYR